MTPLTDILEALRASGEDLTVRTFRGDTRVTVHRDRLLDVLRRLQADFGFDMLADLTCVDYLRYRQATDRFAVVYLLTNTQSNQRLTVRVMVNPPDLTLASVTPLWAGANWAEREVWDMFGIEFKGHPDLRRILLPEQFSAHPLRKDYPLQGCGERHNFPVLRRDQG